MAAFFVSGTPTAKGNIRRNRWGASYDATKGLQDWLDAIRAAALDASDVAGVSAEPIGLELTFFMPRPLAHHVAGDRDRPLRADAPTWPTTRPDVDKLTRAVLDGLKGVVYGDDGQVAYLRAHKVYVGAGGETRPGVAITCTELTT